MNTQIDHGLMREAIMIDASRLIKAKAAKYGVNPHYIHRIKSRAKNSSTMDEMRLESKARIEVMMELLALGYDKDLVGSAFLISRCTLNNIICKYRKERKE